MNWVKENKFLTGFIVVLLIGIGVLGYQVMTASAANDEAVESYNKASGEYARLRHLVPFPNKQNLAAYEKQKEEAAEKITAFEASLAQKEIPTPRLSPSEFQDKLKEAVTAVREKAKESGIHLPDKFYLGFSQYEAQPPKPEAAGPLGRELKAIEWVLNQYLSQSPTRLREVTGLLRADLPEEAGGGGGKGNKGGGSSKGSGFGGSSQGGSGPGSGSGGSGKRDLVRHHAFDITVWCKPPAIMEVLNAVTGAQAPHFFILRQIRIRNEKEKGPARGGEPGKDANDKTVKYIVGEEWIEVTARFEMVDFAHPAEKASANEAAPAPKSAPSRPSPAPATPAPAPATPVPALTPPTTLVPETPTSPPAAASPPPAASTSTPTPKPAPTPP